MGNFDSAHIIESSKYEAATSFDFASMFPKTISLDIEDMYLEAKRERRLEKIGLIDES